MDHRFRLAQWHTTECATARNGAELPLRSTLHRSEQCCVSVDSALFETVVKFSEWIIASVSHSGTRPSVPLLGTAPSYHFDRLSTVPSSAALAWTQHCSRRW